MDLLRAAWRGASLRAWQRLARTALGAAVLLMVLGGHALAAEAQVSQQAAGTANDDGLTVVAALLGVLPLLLLARLLLSRGRGTAHRGMPNLHPDLILPPAIFPDILSEDSRA